MYKLTPDQEKRFVANTQAAFNSWVSASVLRKLTLIQRAEKATTRTEIDSIKQLWFCDQCDNVLSLGLKSNGVMHARNACVHCLHSYMPPFVKNSDVLSNDAAILSDLPLTLNIERPQLQRLNLAHDLEDLLCPITLRGADGMLHDAFNKQIADLFAKRNVFPVGSFSKMQNRSSRGEYADYLKTDEWRRIRDAVMVRDKGMCQGCLKWPASEVHHKTYEHYNNGQEMAFELVSLCRDCHEKVHGR